jgi:hypothetical protein
LKSVKIVIELPYVFGRCYYAKADLLLQQRKRYHITWIVLALQGAFKSGTNKMAHINNDRQVKAALSQLRETLKSRGFKVTDFELEVVHGTPTTWKFRGSTERIPGLLAGEESSDKKLWNKHCGRFGLEARDRLKTILYKGKVHTSVGINARAPRFPVITVREGDGHRVRFPATAVKEGSLSEQNGAQSDVEVL